jgi:uncharacterized damage-inducible protein DinB
MAKSRDSSTDKLRPLIGHFTTEFHRYRDLIDKAMAQVPDDALNRVPAEEANSIAMLVRHISGNLRSRFTDFLTSDGEKPWRERDNEFVERPYTRDELRKMWDASWQIVDDTLGGLTDAHLPQTVVIRGVPGTVQEALCRATAHIAYHAGQIVLLCRMHGTNTWTSLSIPKRK